MDVSRFLTMEMITRKRLNMGGRVAGIVFRNPAGIKTQARLWYRRNYGIQRDRKEGTGFSAPPATININLTRRCNLSCLMCEQHRRSDEPPSNLTYYDPERELPVRVWADFLDRIRSFRPQLYITGGEPTLYPGCREFLSHAKRRGFVIHLQTNGILLEKYAEFFVEVGLEQVTVSLDGPENIHDVIRGLTGAFDRAARGVRALVKARERHKRPGPLLTINCVISKHNLETLTEMVPLAADLGADIIQLQHTIFNTRENVDRHNRVFPEEVQAEAGDIDVIPPSIPENEYYESEITSEDVETIERALLLARKQGRGLIEVNCLPNLPLNLLAAYYLDLGYPFPPVCDALWKTARIMPDGTVSPCLHVIAGNIAEEPFPRIWNGATLRRFRRFISKNLVPGCVRCCSRCFVS